MTSLRLTQELGLEFTDVKAKRNTLIINNKIVRLDLSDFALTAIPSYHPELIDLERLDLSYNMLSDFPIWVLTIPIIRKVKIY